MLPIWKLAKTLRTLSPWGEEGYVGVCSVTTGYNISVTAMSQILGGDPRIHPTAHSQILTIVTRRGCTPGTFTRNLNLNAVHVIKILYADLNSPFCTRTIARIRGCLQRGNVATVLQYANSAPRNGRGTLRSVIGHRISTIILVNSAFHRRKSGTRVTATTGRVPIIVVGNRLSVPNMCYISTSRGKTIGRLMNRLVNHRHHHVLFLRSEVACDYQRGVSNCRRTFRRTNIRIGPRLVIPIRQRLSTIGTYVGRLLIGKISFSTIVNSRSVLTLNARGTLRHVNLGLPVVNFGGSVLTRYTAPRLSDISGRLASLYATTVTTLSDLLRNGRTTPRAIVSTRLMRQSAFHGGWTVLVGRRRCRDICKRKFSAKSQRHRDPMSRPHHWSTRRQLSLPRQPNKRHH